MQEAGSLNDSCLVHGDRLSLWCKTCLEPLCGLCVLENHLGNKHSVEQIASIPDIDKNFLKTQAKTLFEHSQKQQKRIMKEIYACVLKMVDLCDANDSVDHHVKTVGEFLDTQETVTSISAFIKTLSMLKAGTECAKQVTECVFQDTEDQYQSDESVDSINSRATERQEDTTIEKAVQKVRFSAKSTDGRHMKLQVQNGRLHACALTDQAEDPHFTVQVRIRVFFFFF